MANISSAFGQITITSTQMASSMLLKHVMALANDKEYGFYTNLGEYHHVVHEDTGLVECITAFTGSGRWCFVNTLENFLRGCFSEYLNGSKNVRKDIQILKDNSWNIEFKFVDEEEGCELLEEAKVTVWHKEGTLDFLEKPEKMISFDRTVSYDHTWTNLIKLDVRTLGEIVEQEFDGLDEESVSSFKEKLESEYKGLIEIYGSLEKMKNTSTYFKELYEKAYPAPKKEKNIQERMIDALKESGVDVSQYSIDVIVCKPNNSDVAKNYNYNDKYEEKMLNALRCMNSKYFDPVKGRMFTGLYGTVRLMDVDKKIKTFFELSARYKNRFESMTKTVAESLFEEWSEAVAEQIKRNDAFKGSNSFMKLNKRLMLYCVKIQNFVSIRQGHTGEFIETWRKGYVKCNTKTNKVSNFSEYYRTLTSLEVFEWLQARHPDWFKESARKEVECYVVDDNSELFKLEKRIKEWLKPEYTMI